MPETSMKTLSLILAMSVPLAACSWGIKLDSGGEKVRTAWDGNVTGCKDMGQITVSVLDHVGPMDRNGLKVRDELEVMARNEAAGMSADTIKPVGDPRDGQQNWGAYHCGPGEHARRAPMRIEQKSGDNTETFPIKDH
jgi:hypothetical protein